MLAEEPIGDAEVPLLKSESQTRDRESWVNLGKALVDDYQEQIQSGAVFDKKA